MVGTLRSTDSAFTSTDGREASTHFGVGYGRGRTGHPTSAHVHQYVRLGDQAWGNGNWDPSGAWDDRYPTTLVNSRTVSIDTTTTAAASRAPARASCPRRSSLPRSGSMPCCCAATSPSSKAPGSGSAPHRDRDHPRAPGDPGRPHHLVDHHYIAGRLKPSCWRPWADDPTGFPQARYLAALAPAPSEPEETVNSYPVPTVPSIATVPAGTWLYATSALEPSPDNIQVDPGRDMPYLGQPASTARIVEYVDAKGVHQGRSMFAKASEVISMRPAPDPHPVQSGAARRCREDRGREVRSLTMTDNQPGTIWGREPAMVLALVQAVIALVVAFGLNLAPDQIGAILAVTAVILGLVTRSQVSPA